MEFSFLQINLNRSQLAQDTFMQNFHRWKIDVGIIAERNYIPSRWISDQTRSATVALCDHNCPHVVIDSGLGFVAVNIKDLLIISCYYSPSLSTEIFKERLHSLHDLILEAKCRNVIIAGDFNANLVLWGSNRNTPRSHALSDLMASIDMIAYKCVRARGSSVVDLTWVSPSLINWICD